MARKDFSWFLTVLPILASVGLWWFISDPVTLLEWAQGQNFFIILLLPVIQAVILPAHNFTMNVFAGLVFGPYWGFIYSYLGWLIGASLSFIYHRCAWKMRSGKVAGRFKEIKEVLESGNGWTLVALGSLVPLVSDDALVIGIAATGILSYRKTLLAFALGLIPGKFATAFFGEGVSGIFHWVISSSPWTRNCWEGAVIMAAYLVIGFIIWYRERVRLHVLNQIIFGRSRSLKEGD